MTPELVALARRAVACKGWRWMGGMLDTDGRRLREGDILDPTRTLPDLTDPATLGCFLALVREAWGDPGFYVARSNTRIKDTDILGWDFFGNLHGKSCKGMLYRSEAEALVDALEAST